MDEIRKAFEAHCARNWIDVDRVMDGPYKDASTQRAWEAWQAAIEWEQARRKTLADKLWAERRIATARQFGVIDQERHQ